MSVDQRIIEGLVMTDQILTPADPDAAYEVIERSARQRSRRARAGLAVAAVAAAAAVGVALVQIPEPDASPAPTGPSSPPSSSTVTDAGPSPIEGVWRTEAVTFSDFATTLRSTGLAAWVDDLQGELRGMGRTRLTLRLVDGRSMLTFGSLGSIDEQEYVLGTGTIALVTPALRPTRSTFTTRLGEGWVMNLTFVDTREQRTDGIPDEVWLRALYTSTAFHKVDP